MLSTLFIGGELRSPQNLYKPIFQRCTEIPVYVNDTSHDVLFRHQVIRALEEISHISKTRFNFKGYTTEVPQTPFYPRWADRNYFVISLIDRWQSDIFPNENALAAATFFRERTGAVRSHIAVVVIDRAAFSSLSNQDSNVRSKMTVLRHELGHIAGFGHDSGRTVMNARALSFFHPFTKLPWPKIPKTSNIDRCAGY